MKKIFCSLMAVFAIAITLVAEEQKYSAVQFMQILRDGVARNNGSSYAILDGYVEHLRRGDDEAEEYPLFMGVIITSERSMSQIIINNNEGYFIGQSKENNIVPMHKNPPENGSKLERSGLDPADLSMNFLYYDLVEELENVTLKMVNCRVFLLKNPKSNELVKIYVAEKYFFTLKAEFFADSDSYLANKVARTLEINSFKKQNNLYYVESLNIFGPGWRTSVVFEKAEVNLYNPQDNKQIFRQLKQ